MKCLFAPFSELITYTGLIGKQGRKQKQANVLMQNFISKIFSYLLVITYVTYRIV